MSKTFDQGKDEVARLSRQFEINRAQFLAPTFKEAHVRQSLIDPLAAAYGTFRGAAGANAPRETGA